MCHQAKVVLIKYSMLRNSASGPELRRPGKISAGFQSGRHQIGPLAGLRPAGGPIFKFSRLESGRNPARKPDFWPGRRLRNKRPSKPYQFIGSRGMDVTKPYKFIRHGDIHGPKPYKCIGFRWVFMSQTPLLPNIGYHHHRRDPRMGWKHY